MKKTDVTIGDVYIVKVSDKLTEVRLTGENPHGGWDGTNLKTGRAVRIRGAGRLRRRVERPPAERRESTGATTVPTVREPVPVEASIQEEHGDATLPNLGDPVQNLHDGQEGDATMANRRNKGIITCTACGRVIQLARSRSGGCYRGKCECGQAYQLGKRLNKLNGATHLVSGLADAETLEQPKASEPPKRKRRERSDGKMSGLDAAAKVLADAGEPLGCEEVVKRMLDTGLWATGGKTPAATIYAAITRDIARQGEASRFRKTDRGKFSVAK
jgi:hypothetical protein